MDRDERNEKIDTEDTQIEANVASHPIDVEEHRDDERPEFSEQDSLNGLNKTIQYLARKLSY